MKAIMTNLTFATVINSLALKLVLMTKFDITYA